LEKKSEIENVKSIIQNYSSHYRICNLNLKLTIDNPFFNNDDSTFSIYPALNGLKLKTGKVLR